MKKFIKYEIIWIFAFFAVFKLINSSKVKVNLNATREELAKSVDDLANEYANAYINFIKTGIETDYLKSFNNEFASLRTKSDWLNLRYGSIEDQYIACATCRTVMKIASYVFQKRDNDANKEQIARETVLFFCRHLQIGTEEACLGIFYSHWQILDYVVQHSKFDPCILCSLISINYCNLYTPTHNWTVDISRKSAAIQQSKNYTVKKSVDDLKIIHITDLHYDPEYRPGALAKCQDQICCKYAPANNVSFNDLAAGYWGDYRRCDTPLHLIESAFEHISKTHERIDYIYYTGDTIPHASRKMTKDEHVRILTEIYELISKYFSCVPVFSCLGNHDSYPKNIFSPEGVPDSISTKWLYEHVYDLWSEWLSADTKETILKGGYYTFSPRPGFRIISLNNIDCYRLNWWRHINGTYAAEQLQWMYDTLIFAEGAGEFVHILMHIPSVEAHCGEIWSREFNRLIERFHLTISAIFNGHSHFDELNVYYTSKGHAVNVAFNAGSLATYVGLNPNYRIYTVEPRKMQVVDFENWSFNLTEANMNGADCMPQWHKLCHFSKDFTNNSSPAGLDALIEKMLSQPKLLQKFWRCKVTNADPFINRGCDKRCMAGTICRLAMSSFFQPDRCYHLVAKMAELKEESSKTKSEGTAILTMNLKLILLFHWLLRTKIFA